MLPRGAPRGVPARLPGPDPGAPARPGPDYDLTSEIHAALLGSSVDLDRGDLEPLQLAAARRAVPVVVGVHELDDRSGGSSLYDSLVTVGPDGGILNRHRKLVPTNPERMVWGMGDGSGLVVVDTPAGRLGGLLCCESYMPLARHALHTQGIEVYVPDLDSGETWIASMRHIAAEGRCWVVSAGCSLRLEDVPSSFAARDRLWAGSDWINPGDSLVVAPVGTVVAGPLHEEHGILLAEIDPPGPVPSIGRSASPGTTRGPTSSAFGSTAAAAARRDARRRIRPCRSPAGTVGVGAQGE